MQAFFFSLSLLQPLLESKKIFFLLSFADRQKQKAKKKKSKRRKKAKKTRMCADGNRKQVLQKKKHALEPDRTKPGPAAKHFCFAHCIETQSLLCTFFLMTSPMRHPSRTTVVNFWLKKNHTLNSH
jgi:hypothetical protein